MRAAAAALLALASPAPAQSDQIVRDIAGAHQLVPADGAPACGILLTARAVAGDAWAARPDPACARLIPALRGVTAWRPRDGIVLLDASLVTRMTFVEDETALPTSPDLANPRHYLVPAIPGFTRLPQPRDMAGDWRLARGGHSCGVRLSLVAGRVDPATRRLSPAPDCAGPARRLDGWRLEAMGLLLTGPDDRLVRLQPGADGRFAGPDGWRLDLRRP